MFAIYDNYSERKLRWEVFQISETDPKGIGNILGFGCWLFLRDHQLKVNDLENRP